MHKHTGTQANMYIINTHVHTNAYIPTHVVYRHTHHTCGSYFNERKREWEKRKRAVFSCILSPWSENVL